MKRLLKRYAAKVSQCTEGEGTTIPELWETTIAKGEKRTLDEYVKMIAANMLTDSFQDIVSFPVLYTMYTHWGVLVTRDYSRPIRVDAV